MDDRALSSGNCNLLLAATQLRQNPRLTCIGACIQVDDPTKYGVIVMDEYGQVQRFVEKPKVRMVLEMDGGSVQDGRMSTVRAVLVRVFGWFAVKPRG